MSLKKLLLIVLLIFFALLLLLVGSIQVARLLLQEEGEGGRAAAGSVGLVEIRGMILDSREPVRQLRHFLKKDDIKAVVVRIDSPGGVVGPSQEIHDEVRRLAAQKKVVVSMGSMAASGGYYIAAPATVIYANPGTITASIGVLIKFSNIEGLMDKIGIKSTTVKTGTFKDAGSPSRPLSPEERAMFQAVIDSTHEQFVRAVAEGRKLPLERVRELADGRILSGEQAKVVGLVDKLGNQQEAVAEAGRLAGISGEPAVVLPPRKKMSYLDLLTDGAEQSINRVVNGVATRGLQLLYE
ncbi:signal peptide peptidase SppA [Trichlorobacter ammonificans]|uniref:Signal peptide peptidase SppA, 36K type n=1 Tax=Trichlorobacter ammonificans TaxID=2916410 RepID=A0ABM9D655_9BACT|nr:signal peptide peptidase SppA [Trichlorobacter ammonificans]CAH2030684.1 Signal peptide peptidase SppA, 36K type [Trichlorobacter ammonificans]